MAELTMDDVARGERVRAVTNNFFFWQGLRFVALGPILIIAAFASLPGIHGVAGKGALIACLLAASFASAAAGRRYRREFGEVRQVPGAHSTRSRIKWLIVYPLMFASLALDLMLPMPILVSGPVWAIGLLLYRHSTGGGRNHYLALAASLGALGFAPLLAAIPAKPMVSVMFLVLGAGFSACAWLDDREMRSILRGAA